MPCEVYLQTNRKDSNHFEFIWSVLGNDQWNASEEIIEYETNDRLLAAIINLGKCCKSLADQHDHGAAIYLETDSDGLDMKHGGEHNTLAALVCPKDDFEALKLRSLYFEYERYLGKIKQYQLQWGLQIRLTK